MSIGTIIITLLVGFGTGSFLLRLAYVDKMRGFKRQLKIMDNIVENELAQNGEIIEALDGDIVLLQAKCEEYQNQYHQCEAKLSSHKSIIRQLEAENKVLREALEPMVKAMKSYQMDVDDDLTLPSHEHRMMMAKATQALKEKE